MDKNKKTNRAVPAVIASVLVIGAAACAAYFMNTGSTEKSSGQKQISETEMPENTTAAVTEALPETTFVTEKTSEKEIIYVNSTAHTFGRVNTSNGDLNMRRKPSSSADIAGKLKKDTLVYIVNREDEWYRIETASGEYAWVHSDYIVLNEYTGSWKDKYRQICTDISEYSSSVFGESGTVDYYLIDFENDNIPELVYSCSSGKDDSTCFVQIFSADDSSLYIDKRRSGTISKILSYENTRELLLSKEFRGECHTSVSWSEGNSLEKTYIHSSFSYQNECPADLYLINGTKVNQSEYLEKVNSLADTDDAEKLDYKALLKKLDSYPESSASVSATETVFFSEDTADSTSDIIDFSDSFTHYYGMIISDAAEVPLYSDSKGKSRNTYEQRGTIVELTGCENGMYSIYYRPEGKNSVPETLYIDASYISCDLTVESWQSKYDEIVRLTENSNGDRQSTAYTLADMNSDGTPELICSITSAYSDTRYTHIYSVFNGDLYVYSTTGSRDSVTFYPNTGCIGISCSDNDENIRVISFSNGKFTQEHTFVWNAGSGEDEEFLIDGDPVTEEGYRDTINLYINSETGDEESTETNEQYCTLSVSEILEMLK